MTEENNFYNPLNLSENDFISSFVIHNDKSKEIIKFIDKGDLSPWRVLIKGERGMGKTSILRKIFLHFDSELKFNRGERNLIIVPIQFPEEQPNIYKIINIWDMILVEMNKVEFFNKGHYDFISNQRQSFRPIGKNIKKENEQLENFSFELIAETLKKNNAKLLLLWDNFFLMLDGIPAEDRALFIKRVEESNLFIIVAATPYKDPDSDIVKKFKETFELKQLEDEQVELLLRSRIRNLNERFSNNESELKKRIKQITELAGGNMRTILTLNSLLEVNDGKFYKRFLELMDRQTPFYLQRIDDFGNSGRTIKRAIIEKMAQNWDGITAGDIAKELNEDSKLVYTHITQLLNMNFIRPAADIEEYTNNNTRITYILTDRILNFWLLLRSNRAIAEEQVKWFVKLVQAWVGTDKIYDWANKMLDFSQKDGSSNEATKILANDVKKQIEEALGISSDFDNNITMKGEDGLEKLFSEVLFNESDKYRFNNKYKNYNDKLESLESYKAKIIKNAINTIIKSEEFKNSDIDSDFFKNKENLALAVYAILQGKTFDLVQSNLKLFIESYKADSGAFEKDDKLDSFVTSTIPKADARYLDKKLEILNTAIGDFLLSKFLKTRSIYYYENKDFKNAIIDRINYLNEIMLQKDDNYEVEHQQSRNFIATCYIELEKYDSAITQLEKIENYRYIFSIYEKLKQITNYENLWNRIVDKKVNHNLKLDELSYIESKLNIMKYEAENKEEYIERVINLLQDNNDITSANMLAWFLFETGKNKELALNVLSKHNEKINTDVNVAHTYACILVWNNRIDEATQLMEKFLYDAEFYDRNITEDIQLLFLLLLAKGQYRYMSSFFTNYKGERFQVKNRFIGIWFVLNKLIDNKDEYLSMRPELKEVVDRMYSVVEEFKGKYK